MRNSRDSIAGLGGCRRNGCRLQIAIHPRSTASPTPRRIAQIRGRGRLLALAAAGDFRFGTHFSDNLLAVPVAIAAAGLLTSIAKAEPLRINGSTTVNLPVAEAAEVLRAEKSMEIRVDTQGGSSGGISALGEGLVEIGMSSKPLSEEDRARYPKMDFHPIRIGADAVALVVSRDVWEDGVRALDRAQMQGIYESRVTNWKEVGGPDRRIVFFNKEPGRGTWEVFAHWLYGDLKNAPLVSHPEVGANEEARTKVATTRGAITPLSASWADRKSVFPLGIRDAATGEVIEPTLANVAAGRYPMSRPLFVITNGEPKGAAKVFIDFLLSPRGQEIVKRHGYLGADQLAGGSAPR